MTQIMRRSTESTFGDQEWVPCPEGIRRFEIGKPVVGLSGFKDKDGGDKHNVSFPLSLTAEAYERAKEEVELGDGQTLSGKTRYRVGLSLGFWRDGQYQSTKLVDFLCSAFGSTNSKKLRRYIEQGGGPQLSPEMPVQEQIAAVEEWLGWLEGLEVYGTITHRQDKQDPHKVWSDFAGPLPIGSLPGQPEPDYQATGRGKLRAMISEAGEAASEDQGSRDVRPAASAVANAARLDQSTVEQEATHDRAVEAKTGTRSYVEVFGDDDN
jgi:hypothetical protein